MADAAESPDTSDDGAEDAFAIGAVVHDREDDDPNDAIVVNRPPQPADEWLAYRQTTVAEDNPDYPADAAVVVVVYAVDLRATFPEWAGTDPLLLDTINATDVSHYSFPAPRLTSLDTDWADASSSLSDGTSTASGEPDQAPATDAPAETAAPGEVSGVGSGTDATAAAPSPSMQALKERLEDGGMAVEIEPDGQAIQASKLGETYRVRPSEVIEGDGALGARLASIVEEYGEE